jgi:hypothetical protein
MGDLFRLVRGAACIAALREAMHSVRPSPTLSWLMDDRLREIGKKDVRIMWLVWIVSCHCLDIAL